MSRHRLSCLAPMFALPLTALALCLALAFPARAQTVTNPLVTAAADPFITYQNGTYYMLGTSLSNDIRIWSSSSLATLGSSAPTSVYNTGAFYESAELFAFNGLWYIYYTQYPNSINVLESDTDNPLGTYHFKANLTNNTYDGDVLIMPNGQLYLLGSTYGSIVIQPLSNPYTVGGGQTTLAVRDQPWEPSGAVEGPNAFWHNGQLNILYTVGHYNESDYAVGDLHYNGGDPTNAGSYSKLPGPLFTQDPNAGVYDAGVPSAFSSPDGLQTWFTYSDYKDTSGQDPSRTILVQPMHFDPNNDPILDTPVPPGQPIPLPSGDPQGARLTGAAFSLTNVAAGLNLDDPGSSRTVGTQVQLYTANGTDAQSWRLDTTGATGVYSLYNVAAELALSDPGDSSALGTKLQLAAPTGDSGQQWNIQLQGGFQRQGDGSYTLTNRAANLNLDDPSGSNQPGTKLQLYTPNGATAQEYQLKPSRDAQGLVSGALYTFTNVAAGLNLDNPSGSKTPFTQVQLYYANNATAQDWRIDAVGDGIYTLTNLASGMLRLDDPGGSHQTGTLLQLYYANTLSPQNWTIRRQPDGSYTLTNQAAGLNLDDPYGSNQPGTKLQLYTPNGATAQEWQIRPAPDPNGIVSGAYYTLTNEGGGLTLSVPGSSTTVLTNVDQEPNTGGTSQQWRLDAVGDGLFSGAYIYTLTNINSGLRLDDPGGSNQPGTLLEQYYPNQYSAQQYQLNRQNDGSYTLTNIAAGLNLDDPYGRTQSGTNVQLYYANGQTPQNWQFQLIGPDTTPPTTTAAFSGVQSGGSYAGPVTVTLSATDPNTASSALTTFYDLDNGGWQTYGGPFTVQGAAVHTVLYYSTDPAHNGEMTETASFTILPSATDVTAQVTVARGGYRYVRATGHFLQTVTLTNTGAALSGPISLVLDALTGAALVSPSGTTAATSPVGSPYVNTAGGLAAHAGASLTLEFTSQPRSYAVRVLAGSGVR